MERSVIHADDYRPSRLNHGAAVFDMSRSSGSPLAATAAAYAHQQYQSSGSNDHANVSSVKDDFLTSNQRQQQWPPKEIVSEVATSPEV